MLEGAKLIGAGAATIALAGAAIGIGNVFSSLIHSVARNPSLAKQLFGYAILGFFALTEAIALFALMMAFLAVLDFDSMALLSKAGAAIAFRAFSTFLVKVGCSGGFALTATVLLKSLFSGYPSSIEMMGRSVGSSEGKSFPGSLGGNSWISEFFSKEEPSLEEEVSKPSSSAHPALQPPERVPVLSGVRQEEVSRPGTSATADQALSISEEYLHAEVDKFTSYYNKISMRSDILLSLHKRLRINQECPGIRKRALLEGIQVILSKQGMERPTSGAKAGKALVAYMESWDERNGF